MSEMKAGVVRSTRVPAGRKPLTAAAGQGPRFVEEAGVVRSTRVPAGRKQ